MAGGEGRDPEDIIVGREWGEKGGELPEGEGELFGNRNGESRVGMAAYAKNDAQGEKSYTNSGAVAQPAYSTYV